MSFSESEMKEHARIVEMEHSCPQCGAKRKPSILEVAYECGSSQSRGHTGICRVMSKASSKGAGA